MSRTKVRSLPRWAEMAKRLRKGQQGFPSQETFARRLGVSTSEVRRWEQGLRAPTVAQAIALGKLAGPPDCWYWWGLAGLSEDDVLAGHSRRAPAGPTGQGKKRPTRIAEETRALLVTALETILDRAPSAVIEEIAAVLTDRAGKYGDWR